jgi:2-dehydro-3-deoxygluconokinase
MSILNLNAAGSCKYDLVSLGEVMLRLDPGEGRIRTARSFQVCEGGGEYNVARGLAKCFRMRTAIVTALVENDVGRLVEDLVMQGGVDTSHIRWVPFDGVGRSARNGLNFTERGFGVRGAVGISDRGHTAASQLKCGDVDWERLFGVEKVRWFHTGGIFAALSSSTAEVVEEAMRAARKYGTIISYDLNYRPSLWKNIGGKEKAQDINRRLGVYVDVMLGNEEDFTSCLGLQVKGTDESFSSLDTKSYADMMRRAIGAYPNLRAVATTLRVVKSATSNDWGAPCYAGEKLFEATWRKDLPILDRVGGGDSFASGLIYGLITTGDPAVAVEYGAAHGALAMTTPGDTSMADLDEVKRLSAGGGARVIR